MTIRRFCRAVAICLLLTMLCSLFCIAAPSSTTAQAATTAVRVSDHGRLRVKNGKIVDQNGNSIVLKGVSTHGINWFPQYVNQKGFQTLRDRWGVSCIRLAMYTAEYNGYCSGGNRAELKKLLDRGVQYATKNDQYVILDWHILNDSNPNLHKAEAKTFFKEMAKKYAGHRNVIYEICNEPNGGTSWSDIRSYALSVIKTIRTYDKKNLILVGTPNWSQDVDIAAQKPITGYANIAYTFHFYAGTHGEAYRQKVTAALRKKLPIFVTEFGATDASGNGAVNTAEANKWIAFLKKHKISFVCWNLSNKNESSALLQPGCTKTSGFTASDLSAQGNWYRRV